MDLTQLFTIDMLGTMAGMTAFVALMTQITKYFVKGTVVEKFDTKWYGLVWSIVANIAALIFLTQDYTASSIFTCFVNTLLVAVAAFGAFDVIKTVDTNVKSKSEGVSGE